MCARLRAVERLAQQYTQSRITQIDGCARKYSGALSCTHERNIGYFALMWHSDVPRNRIFVFLCAVVARKLWEFGRLGICAMPRHCKNSECARLCTYLDRCGVIGQNVCPFWLVFLCGSGRFSCSSCMGGELEVGQNVCPEWPVRPCGTTVE